LPTRTRANMVVKVRIPAKDKVGARPGTTVAKVKTPAKARVDARLPRTAAKAKTGARLVAGFEYKCKARIVFVRTIFETCRLADSHPHAEI
jgi:hypothetical protein